jgi:DNA polymerase-3 subunit alpha
VLGGIITEARRIITKKGDPMCVVKLEDMYGSIEVTVFPRLYADTMDTWNENTVVIVHGEVQMRRDQPGILCNSVEEVKDVEEKMNRKQYQVNITLRLSGDDARSVSDDIILVQDIWNCIRDQPGRDHYNLIIANGEWIAHLKPSIDTMQYERVRDQLEAIIGDQGVIQAELIER